MGVVSANSLCAARIREHYTILSNQEKRVADFILSDWKNIKDATSAKLAKQAGVSDATIIRFCRSIGFKGFTDFKAYMQDHANRPAEFWSSLSEEDSTESIARKVLHYNECAMHDTVSVLDGEVVERAVEMILGAKRIFLFAGGGALISALCVSDAFIQIGIQSYVAQDSLMQIMNAKMLGPDDLAVGISHSGQTAVVVNAMRIASEGGAKTLSIVGLVGSPVTKYSEVVLYTGLAEQSFFSKTITARICELQVISTLYSSIYLKRREAILEHQKGMDVAIAPMFIRK